MLVFSYLKFVHQMNKTPGTIGRKEATDLIQLAKKVDDSASDFWMETCHTGHTNLRKLVNQNESRFSAEGKKLIDLWLTERRLPRSATEI